MENGKMVVSSLYAMLTYSSPKFESNLVPCYETDLNIAWTQISFLNYVVNIF